MELSRKSYLKKLSQIFTIASMAAGVVQADSLLAPIVINADGFNTYFAYKIKGADDNADPSPIHYTFIKKGTSLADMNKLDKICMMENRSGLGSKGDLIFQDVIGNHRYYTGQIPSDNTLTNGYSSGKFVGMVVIDDVAQLGKQDGDMSGFAYVVHPASSTILDYKLLNNHHSSKSGDFSSGFISKTAVDFMWLSSAPNTSAKAPVTSWVLSVTGPDMSNHTGKYNSLYGLKVRISQKSFEGGASPEDIVIGSYNNDEIVVSGDKELLVTCMGSFTNSAFLTPLQRSSSQWGGWTRKTIIAQPDEFNGMNKEKIASGAIIYRSDSNIVTGLSPYTTLQIETSGHLANGHTHVNRPN